MATIQDRFRRTNTIYKITKDIDLGGSTLVIPAGCTLDFQGGSFSNGTVQGNSTKVIAGLLKIFSTNITLSGNWSVVESYPEWFGAIGDGTTDDTVSIQKVVNSFPKVVFSLKTYLITSPIQVKDNSTIQGTFSAQDATSSTIKNSTTGSGVLYYTQDNSTDGKSMPTIEKLTLIGDNGIKLHDEATAIISDNISTTNVPYGMVPIVRKCFVKPLSATGGIGISWSKMFDGRIEDCVVINFDVNILLNGCDLCIVSNNRLYGAVKYNILERSVSSFGSQNRIIHNDILTSKSTATLIKSCGRHVSIIDNYLESTTQCVGGIDISNSNMLITLPGNSAISYSVVVENNRLEGQFSTFNYRLANTARSYRVIDRATIGVLSGKGLSIVDSTGTEVGYFPPMYNVSHGVDIHLESATFGEYNGFKTKYKGNILDKESITTYSRYVSANNAYQNIKINSKGILYLSTYSSANTQAFKFPEFESKIGTYTIEISARSLSAANTTLRLLINSSTGNLATIPFVFTPQLGTVTKQLTLAQDYTPELTFNILFTDNTAGFLLDSIKVYSDTRVSGTTAQRPTSASVGFMYFDTTLGKPIWWNGTAWVEVSTGSGGGVLPASEYIVDVMDAGDTPSIRDSERIINVQ